MYFFIGFVIGLLVGFMAGVFIVSLHSSNFIGGKDV